MRWLLLFILLAGCAAQVERQEAERQEAQEAVQEEAVLPTLELAGCESPAATKETCQYTSCARQGGTCLHASVAENGDHCYVCVPFSCPEGTMSEAECRGTCTDTCETVVKSGPAKCYACIKELCPLGMYVDLSLCDSVCSGKCVATDIGKNYWCYECRGEVYD